jgi:hypothetical protein
LKQLTPDKMNPPHLEMIKDPPPPQVEVSKTSSPTTTEIEVTPEVAPAAYREISKRVVDLMHSGVSFEDATKIVGVDIKVAPESLTKMLTASVITQYHLPAHAARELVRAARNKILLENLMPGGDTKAALDAAKQIASDPDVGLNTPPSPLVQVNITDGLKRLMDSEVDMSNLLEEEKGE